jgi:hypothetical protein
LAVDLNHISSAMLNGIPSTDSRFRGDIRAFECGDFDLA